MKSSLYTYLMEISDNIIRATADLAYIYWLNVLQLIVLIVIAIKV